MLSDSENLPKKISQGDGIDTDGIHSTGGARLLGDQGRFSEEGMLESRPGQRTREPAQGAPKALLQGAEAGPGWQSAEAHKDKGRPEGSAFSMTFLEGKRNFCEWQRRM